ncbi:hypothetical protein IAS59_006533 [Cryptococcus gattii]
MFTSLPPGLMAAPLTNSSKFPKRVAGTRFKLPPQDWNGAKSTLSVKTDLTTFCRRTPLVVEKFIITRYSQKRTI